MRSGQRDAEAAAEKAERAGRSPRSFRGGAFGRLPGWHVHEVVEAIRHFEGGKEAIQAIREEIAGRLPEPQALDHFVRCLIGAFLGGCTPGKELELAHRIHSVELAAHLAAMREIPPLLSPSRNGMENHA